MVMKEIEKVDPKQHFLDQFEKAFGDDFLPKEWSKEKKNRVAAETTSGKIKTGMVTSIPMICYGEKCAFKDQCALFQQGDHPLGYKCPYELGMVKTLMADYAESLEIDINDITEYAQVRDLINLDVQFMRAAKYLSKESFIQENVVGISGDGEVIFRKELHLAVELEDKLSKRKSQLLKQLVATREAKVKANAVNYQSVQSISNVMQNFKEIMHQEDQAKKKRLGIIDVDDYIAGGEMFNEEELVENYTDEE